MSVPGVTLASIQAHAHPLQSALTNGGPHGRGRRAVHPGTLVSPFSSAFGALEAYILSRHYEAVDTPRSSAWESQPGRPCESEGGD